MSLPRPTPTPLLRRALAVVVVFSQFIAATGAPAFSPRHGPKKGSTPFPCQDHPCGCMSAEEGWAGDCCCFTLEQKLAWADERGIVPPPHVRPMVESRRSAEEQKLKAKQTQKPKSKAKPSCCATHEAPPAHSECAACETREITPPKAAPQEQVSSAPVVRLVATVFMQKCRGEGPGGVLKGEVSIPPTEPVKDRQSPPACGSHPHFDSRASFTSFRPPVPPPRMS